MVWLHGTILWTMNTELNWKDARESNWSNPLFKFEAKFKIFHYNYGFDYICLITNLWHWSGCSLAFKICQTFIQFKFESLSILWFKICEIWHLYQISHYIMSIILWSEMIKNLNSHKIDNFVISIDWSKRNFELFMSELLSDQTMWFWLAK